MRLQVIIEIRYIFGTVRTELVRLRCALLPQVVVVVREALEHICERVGVLGRLQQHRKIFWKHDIVLRVRLCWSHRKLSVVAAGLCQREMLFPRATCLLCL